MSIERTFIDAHAMLGREAHLVLDADELLRRMDASGIERAVVRPMGAGLAVDNREANDDLIGKHSRLHGLAVANPWFGARAVDELKRARDLGAVGLFLHPSRQGFMPVEPVAAPLFEAASEFGWPVMVHTGTYVQADLLAVAEVARRLPETKFVAGFGGFTDMWFELPGVFKAVPNLILDASMIWGAAVEEIVRNGGGERVLFGGAEPRNRYGIVKRMVERLDFDEADKVRICSENARRVYRLP